MAVIDWKLASIGVMLLVGVFNVVSRRFFERGEDWRLFIPFAAVACLGMLAYFAISYREVKFTESGLALGLLMALMVGITAVLTALVYADRTAPLSVAVPIMGMSIVITAAIAVLFLGEELTAFKAAGIVLGAVSIGLLAWK